MNLEQQLKLQSWLDGELSPAEAREVEAWLEQDAAAQALHGELSRTKAALHGNEPEHKLPESRDFHWSKIKGAIVREARAIERAPAPQISVLGWIKRILVPAAGLAVVATMVFVSSSRTPGLLPLAAASDMDEIETASSDMGAYTFRSEAEGMTVVWLYDRSDDSEVAANDASANTSQP